MPELFENTNINLIGQYGSGLPYTFNPARAIYVPEANNSRLPERLTFDLYIQKTFLLGPVNASIFADIRNVFNKRNAISVYSATGSPFDTGEQSNRATKDYMYDPTNFASPRTIYLGINIDF
jgi:hypothetical protein